MDRNSFGSIAVNVFLKRGAVIKAGPVMSGWLTLDIGAYPTRVDLYMDPPAAEQLLEALQKVVCEYRAAQGAVA